MIMPNSKIAGKTEPPQVAAEAKKVVNVGLIGFGIMGRIRYDAIGQSGHGQLVAVSELPGVSKPTDVRCYDSPDDLIADPEVEAVFICTPNYLNKPLTIRALQAGKHVFCEKPPAFNAPEVEEIMAVEQASGGKKLMYGFNHRHHESIKKTKELVDSGVYGRILWMRGRYGKSVDQSFYNQWRAKKEFAGGGILMDQGIHLLDLFLMMGGEFEEVMAFVSNLYWNLDVEDNVFAILRNREGIVASLHSTMTQWRHLFSFEVFLEHGYIVINGLLTTSGTYGEEEMAIVKNRTAAPAATWSDEEHIRYTVNDSWSQEVTQFFRSIQQDTPVMVGNSQDALRLLRVMDKIYQNG